MAVNVLDVVRQYQIEAGYDSSHNTSRLLNIAISGLKEMHYDVTGEPVFVQLDLDSNNTAEVPTGLVNVIKMWLNVENYGLLEIVSSDTQPINLVNNLGETEEADKSTLDRDYLDGWGYRDNPGAYFQGGEFTGGIYHGVKPNPYTYRLNTATNKFEFSSNVKKPILEYLGTMTTVKGKHIVPDMAVDALIHWLRWVDTRNKNISPREKDYNQRMYVAAKNMVLRRMAEVTPATMRAAARSAYSLTTK